MGTMKHWSYPFFIGCAIGGALVIAYGQFGPVNPTKAAWKIKAPGISIIINSEGEGLDYHAILEAMFDNSFIKSAAIKWLGKEHNIYSLEEAELGEAIEESLCDEIPEKPFEERLSKAKECAKKPVAAKLRELANSHQPPFHFLGFKGDAGFPAGQGAPTKGHANVCKNGPFYGKQLQVVNPKNNTLVEVNASRSLGDCTGFGGRPDIQLGSHDAYTLFPGESLDITEEVIIIPL
ncbi:hypothetical protein [Synechococcus sp. MIT S9507]|uniref:hypothetical protein n=1 Tax=Synechococcus sp. MIT S9507 TaxID=3082544 RepID=UPI0039B64D63